MDERVRVIHRTAAVLAADTTDGEPLSLEATLERAAQALRAMGYEHRLHLLVLLQDGEQTPGALAEAVDLESTLVAHHLRCLRDARLIRRQRRGRNVFYTIDGDATRQLVQDVIRFARQPG
jgi:DNA-binding transcriptional ArsR family regulator